ncbi:hypothetical protein [Ornithinibacillus salinisoli]
MEKLKFPVVGNTYISKKPNFKYSKVKVLEHNEEVYKFTGGDTPLSLVTFKVLEPKDAHGNIDIEISDFFHDNYIEERKNEFFGR